VIFLYEKIKDYFLSKGWKELKKEFKYKKELDFIFKDELDSIIFVRILSKDELIDRNSLLENILELFSLKEEVNKIYIAMPKVYVSIIDSSPFEEYGIGIISYDEKKVMEISPAKFFKTKSKIEEEKMEKLISFETLKLKEELDNIKKRLINLEEMVQSLNNEIKILKSQSKPIIETKISKEEIIITPPSSENIPSFLKDNPWIEILAKRGREEKIAV
jgi:ATP:corrinoid adenosyltransferase